jgi:CDP-diacylglycerol---glycerol-3-phosphate 3-phosphatidyltransferase
MATRTQGAEAPWTAWWLLFAAAAVAVGSATGLLLHDRLRAGGAATSVAGGLLVGLAVGARRTGNGVKRILDSFADRAFDGLVLAAVAWATRSAEPRAAAAALVALGAGFLAAYVRARGESLGYQVEESVVTRGIRYAVLSAGLIGGWLTASLSALAAFNVLAALVRVSQVAKEERA